VPVEPVVVVPVELVVVVPVEPAVVVPVELVVVVPPELVVVAPVEVVTVVVVVPCVGFDVVTTCASAATAAIEAATHTLRVMGPKLYFICKTSLCRNLPGVGAPGVCPAIRPEGWTRKGFRRALRKLWTLVETNANRLLTRGSVMCRAQRERPFVRVVSTERLRRL
jgi:hypothetical protein